MTILLWQLISITLGSLAVGAGAGFAARKVLLDKKLTKAEERNKDLLIKAKDEAYEIREKSLKEVEKRRSDLDEIERNLREKDKMQEKRSFELDRVRSEIDNEKKEAIEKTKKIDEILLLQNKKLESIAKLNKKDAEKILFDSLEKEFKDDLVRKIKEIKTYHKEEAEKEARKIISTAVERYAGEQTSEITTYSVHLPSEDLKGRIIGKEGRNIQHFEKLSGVDVIIDDSPDSVMISCFDPVRRYIGKLALEQLISDGRIHQGRIEEVLKKIEENISKEIKEAGENAAIEVGVVGLHPDLTKILGRLKFRTSYGQNQLEHAKEVAIIAGLLASEIRADVNVAKKAALLHDIGKAIDHEVSGAHHHISMEIAKKYGLSEVVINAIGAHHDDIEPKTVEAVIVKAADAISGARPGARRESVEHYVKRMTELENVANSFNGVDKSFAIQAGREVRIIVHPQEINDLEAMKLAKDIAHKIENELQYPGEIKVNVIRETRAVEMAK